MPLFHTSSAHIRERLTLLTDRIVELMDKIGLAFLRLGIGLVFVSFGLLKPLRILPTEIAIDHNLGLTRDPVGGFV